MRRYALVLGTVLAIGTTAAGSVLGEIAPPAWEGGISSGHAGGMLAVNVHQRVHTNHLAAIGWLPGHPDNLAAPLQVDRDVVAPAICGGAIQRPSTGYGVERIHPTNHAYHRGGQLYFQSRPTHVMGHPPPTRMQVMFGMRRGGLDEMPTIIFD